MNLPGRTSQAWYDLVTPGSLVVPLGNPQVAYQDNQARNPQGIPQVPWRNQDNQGRGLPGYTAVGGLGDTPVYRIFSDFSEPFLFLVVNR